jgi:2-phosphosulfolactate phosphatase
MPYTQALHRCRHEWGRDGARRAASRGDILVVVDLLSFSTAVATAIDGGAIVYPCGHAEDAAALAASLGAESAVHRRDVPARGRFSLSPLSFLDVMPGTRIVLPSPNGATCSRHARDVPHLFVGALVNATAVARAANRLLATTDLGITILSCGERWSAPGEDGELRFALEDYLGAGAIIAGLECDKSPEALACEGAFMSLRGGLKRAILDCGSGLELIEKGCEGDVIHAARLDRYTTVPVMREGAVINAKF